MLHIRQTDDSDFDDLLQVERMAFGQDAEAELVRNLLADPTARPLVSLLAFQDDRPVGHILFTAARADSVDAALLAVYQVVMLGDGPAPLAVVPTAQKQGIGGKLIEHGLGHLKDTGIGLAFVLGHPQYYPRYGFQPAGRLGFDAPYPIAEKDADAWMVQALKPGLVGTIRSKVTCANAISRPEYWQE